MTDYSRKQLYAAGEPLGASVTRREAGRIVYGGGGGGGDSTTTPTIPDEFKPLAKLYTQRATQYANTPFQAYTGQRFADLNGTQNQALQMVQDRAVNGSPVMDQANSTLIQKLQGGETNPYLDSMVKKAQTSVAENFNNQVMPGLSSQMAGSGSFGNSGMQQVMANAAKASQQNAADIATSMYGNAYNTDRANQMQALGMAQSYGNQAYTDAGQLLNAGNTQQNQAQQGLDFGYQQFQQQQDYPLKQLQAIGGVLGQNMGSRTTQSGGK